MNALPPIDRKEIADLMGGKISPRTIGRREAAWGFDKARIGAKTRSAMYRRSVVLAILRNMGIGV